MSSFHKETTEKEIFDRKASGRRDIAKLPIEEKIKRLVKLQHMAHSVAIAAGRESKRPWNIKTSNNSES